MVGPSGGLSGICSGKAYYGGGLTPESRRTHTHRLTRLVSQPRDLPPASLHSTLLIGKSRSRQVFDELRERRPAIAP